LHGGKRRRRGVRGHDKCRRKKKDANRKKGKGRKVRSKVLKERTTGGEIPRLLEKNPQPRGKGNSEPHREKSSGKRETKEKRLIQKALSKGERESGREKPVGERGITGLTIYLRSSIGSCQGQEKRGATNCPEELTARREKNRKGKMAKGL